MTASPQPLHAPAGWVARRLGIICLYLLPLAHPSEAQEVIRNDGGGSIRQRELMIATETAPPQIVGTCASACTMHLQTGCVAPGAVLVFHGPSWASGRPMGPMAFDAVSRRLASYYPPAIAAWFMEVGRYGQHPMTGAEAIRLGARAC